MRTQMRLLALGATAAIFIGACSPAASSVAPSAEAYKACVVFDTGGLGDKGFNDLAKKGLKDAAARATTPPSPRPRAPRTTRRTSSA